MDELHVRKIAIDIIPDGVPFIELLVERHVFDSDGNRAQIIGNYGRVYKRITDFNPIPIGTMADDGVIDNYELMYLVGFAALTWVAIEYGTTVTPEGKVLIE